MLAASPARAAEEYLDEAYKLYFKYHPAADRPPRTDFYPFPGPIIHAGEDLPICAEAKQAETYVREKRVGLRYLRHGQAGWVFSDQDFRTDYTLSPQSVEYFDRLNKALKAKGQKLIVFFGPPRGMLSLQHIDPAEIPKGYTATQAKQGYGAFIKQLESLGVTVVGVTEPPPGGADYFNTGDIHWTLEGARYSAGIVADTIRAAPGFSAIEKQDFQSEPVGYIKPGQGGYESSLGRICRMNIEIHTEQAWATTMKTEGEKATDASLFADTPFPAITALGTSYLAYDDRYNFVGTLKEKLHTDVYNAALTGGGFGGSALRYFASDEYRQHPPKVVLWEFIYTHNVNKQDSLDSFRQMIPAVEGPCDAKNAVASWSGDIAAATTDFLDKARGIPLKNTYLYMEVTGPTERQLNLQILYSDGNADDLDMTRSTRIGNNGKYYLELADNTPAPALYFRLATDKAKGHLDARLCRYAPGAGRP
jgi:alginate biosynthesis protein AlgX